MAATTATIDREAVRKAAVRNYELCGVAALAVLGLALLQRGYGVWCLLPMLAGGLGILLRWTTGPVILLLALLFELFDQWTIGWVSSDAWDVSDLLQCGAVLAYSIAQLRLLGLTHGLIPPDPRVRQRLIDKPAQRAVTQPEITRLLIGVAVWPLLAILLWTSLPAEWHELGLPAALWRLLLMLWLLGVGLYLASGLFRYLARERLTVAEATMYLQDEVWADHRGEQRRGARWLAWASLRYQRRNEKEMP